MEVAGQQESKTVVAEAEVLDSVTLPIPSLSRPVLYLRP